MAPEPDPVQALLEAGAALVAAKAFARAEALYAEGLAAHPGEPRLHVNRGVLRVCQGRPGEAEACFREALRLDPDYAMARYNLAYLLLRSGRFEEGWPALEARAWSLELTARIPAPRWQGEDLVGKALLVGCEGGCGDMLHFARFLPELRRLGVRQVGLVAQRELARLLRTLPGVDVVIPVGDPVPDLGWDLWTLPMSLPHRLGTGAEPLAWRVPYLDVDPVDRAAWAARLPPARRRIGVAWRGNAAFENNQDRSLPGLDLLAPLAALEGTRFVSLQKGEQEGAAPPRGLPWFDAAPWLGDFADTAALVGHLDAVVSVDTAVAHLAGALGCPGFVLLSAYKTDWRWAADRADSPWYPSLRLLRQREAGAWEPVVAELLAALQAAG